MVPNISLLTDFCFIDFKVFQWDLFGKELLGDECLLVTLKDQVKIGRNRYDNPSQACVCVCARFKFWGVAGSEDFACATPLDFQGKA